MGMRLIERTDVEPVTLEDARLHLRNPPEEHNPVIESKIYAAREDVEQMTGRALLLQKWELTLDSFPCATRANRFAAIVVPKPPLRTVVSVKYTKPDGTEETLAVTEYVVETEHAAEEARCGRIYPAFQKSWPTAACAPNAVRVVFTAGYTLVHADELADPSAGVPPDWVKPEEVPEKLREAMRKLLTKWWARRGDEMQQGFTPEQGTAEGVEDLVGAFRVFE